jgi:hypothetical protein
MSVCNIKCGAMGKLRLQMNKDDSSYHHVSSVRYSCCSQDPACWSSHRTCPLPVLSGLSITTRVYCWGWIWHPQGKGLVWMGRYVMMEALSTACPSWSTGWSPETSKNQYFLLLNSVTTEDTAVCYCARNTITGLQCNSWHKSPCRGTQEQHGTLKTQLAKHQFQWQVQTHRWTFLLEALAPTQSSTRQYHGDLSCLTKH